jgi:hypothetical protein
MTLAGRAVVVMKISSVVTVTPTTSAVEMAITLAVDLCTFSSHVWRVRT